MVWMKQSEDDKIPLWLKQNLDSHCKCGTEKENYYNERGECTGRRCPNKQCPYTLAQRIADMCQILKVDGIKEGKGMQIVRDYALKSHFEAVPIIFKEKPTISLYQLLRISFIRGVDTQWDNICDCNSSIDELIQNYNGKHKYLLIENYQELKYGESFFYILKPEKKKCETLISGNVMISGNIRGFENRDDFIHAINYVSKGLVDIKVKGKRKTNIMCLIQEKDEPNRGKAECALEYGIPIMTPEEFKNYIIKELKKRLAEVKK